MILKEINERIIVDEIRANAKKSEIYFLSHLLDNALLSITETWKGIIYTSVFIYKVLHRRPQQNAHPTRFKTLMPNVAYAFQIKEVRLWVTMIETGEITNNVMFLFDDGKKTHLYTGVFSEVGNLYRNEHFMQIVEKGIDSVYIDTRRCKSKAHIFTDETIDEIKAILEKDADLKAVLIVPAFGYEELLVSLAKAFPKSVRVISSYHKIMLSKLGYDSLLTSDNTFRILVRLPGIDSDVLSSDEFVTIYITEGSAPKTSKEYGVHTVHWSPLPSFMNLQSLLELIKPKEMIPIKTECLDDDEYIPPRLEWLLDKSQRDARSNESDKYENDYDSSFSGRSLSSNTTESTKSIHPPSLESLDATVIFHRPTKLNSTVRVPEFEAVDLDKIPKMETKEKNETVASKCNLIKKRTRIIRHRTNINFDDSDS